MAEHDLIDAYLAELRRSLRRRSDVDDVVAEVEDHLREVVAGHVRAGMSPDTAARHALGQFGTTEIVRRAFDANPKGGAAMPTTITRIAGLCAMLGGAIIAIAFAIGSVTELDAGPNSAWFAPLATTGFALALAGLVGIHLRHRAIYSSRGRVGRLLIPIGIVGGIASVFAWFGPGVILSLVVIGTGLVLVGADVWSAGVLDRRPLLLLAIGVPVGMIVTVIGGSGVSWETYASIAALIGLGAGFAWLGYDLWQEHATADRPPTATA